MRETSTWYEGDSSKNPWNYLLEGRPLVVQAPAARRVLCSRNPSVSVQPPALSTSVHLFLKTFFHQVCPFHDGWFTSLPTHTTTAWPHVPPSLFMQGTFFFFVSLDEKSPQREMFCWCRRGGTKNGGSHRRHQNWQVRKLFWAVEKQSR